MKARLAVSGKTDPGCVRKNNEDSFAIDQDLGLLIVADGMGGHNSGEIASRLATDTIIEFARKVLSAGKPVGSEEMKHLIEMANTVIFEKAKAFPQNQGMGTTVVAALVGPKTVIVAHVGDSRCYAARNGGLQPLTEDHSLVMDQVRRGLLTAEEAEHSELQNVLIRALGTEPGVVVDVQEHPVLPGDVLLLCTDGLTKMVRDAAIAKILEACAEPDAACETLIKEARNAGGVDNVTAIVARVPGGERGVKGLIQRIFRAV